MLLVKDVLVEVADLDAQEFAELINFVRDEFHLEELFPDQDDLEVHVEDALNAGVEMLKVIRMFQS